MCQCWQSIGKESSCRLGPPTCSQSPLCLLLTLILITPSHQFEVTCLFILVPEGQKAFPLILNSPYLEESLVHIRYVCLIYSFCLSRNPVLMYSVLHLVGTSFLSCQWWCYPLWQRKKEREEERKKSHVMMFKNISWHYRNASQGLKEMKEKRTKQNKANSLNTILSRSLNFILSLVPKNNFK